MKSIGFRSIAVWICVACAWLCAASVQANVVRSNAAEAELVAAQSAVVPGQSLDLGLRLKLDPGWHVYWKNAGDSGTPPALHLKLPPGFKAEQLQFAYPQRIPIAHLVNYGYEGEVLFPVRVEVPATAARASTVTLEARAEWLECKESCLPASANLSLALPVATGATPGIWSSLFKTTQANLPIALPATVKLASSRQSDSMQLYVEGLKDCSGSDFFPDREGIFVHAKIARVASDTGLRFALPLETNASRPEQLTGVLTCATAAGATRAYQVATPVAVAAAASPSTTIAPASDTLSLGAALLFALLGGLVLNLMPCVFPVLGLKVLGLSGREAQAKNARVVHAIQYLAGVVLSCLILAAVMLALRASGEQVGWGFQLQSGTFVSALAVLFFLLALNLSGYFEWGIGVQSAAAKASSRWRGAFFDGVLVVLVASPCTAPLMGAAIGFTLAQPAATILAVFSALAVGIALPYVILVLEPRLLRRLPKPGRWLETVRQFLAFPLYATVLWLAWVLGELAGLSAVIRLGTVLLALVFAIWLWRGRRLVAISTAALVVLGAVLWLNAGLVRVDAGTMRESVRDEGIWQPWSAAAVEDHRQQGKSVLVDFTAAWCVTCQVNKHAVLNTASVGEALRSTGTVALRADWTRRDPQIAQALAQLGRNGVPVYALYGANGRVTLLPEILTTQMVVDALRNHSKIAGVPR